MNERIVKTSRGWVLQVKPFGLNWAGVNSGLKLIYDQEQQLISCCYTSKGVAEYALEQYKKKKQDLDMLSSN